MIYELVTLSIVVDKCRPIQALGPPPYVHIRSLSDKFLNNKKR